MKHAVICNPSFNTDGYVGGFGNFRFSDCEISCGIMDIEEEMPEVGSKEVLIKVNAFSCNYRDRALMLSFNDQCQKITPPVFSPFGSDFVAEIVIAGDDVNSLRPADRVIPDCTYPQKEYSKIAGIPTNFASQRYHVLNYDQLIKIPDNLSDEKAAAFSIGSQTSYSMVRKLNIKEDDNILILSATSNTSLFALMALKGKYKNIYAVSTRSEYYDKLYELGVKECISTKELKELSKRINGFDAVIDPFFDIHLPQLPEIMNDMGRYVTCGLCNQYGNIDYDELFSAKDYIDAISLCVIKNISIIGNCLGIRKDLEDALNDYGNGVYEIIIDSVYDKDVKSFLSRSHLDSDRIGKVVFKYDD